MKVFIAGARKISKLDKNILKKLQSILNSGAEILVGDANGVDKAIQQFFSDNFYNNVYVYATNGIARNNIGSWQIVNVETKQQRKDFSFYTIKDKKMASDCDYGFMIWNGESKGTLNNMVNLTTMDKKVIVYFAPENIFYMINSYDGLEKFVLSKCDDKTKKVYNELAQKKEEFEQMIINY